MMDVHPTVLYANYISIKLEEKEVSCGHMLSFLLYLRVELPAHMIGVYLIY